MFGQILLRCMMMVQINIITFSKYCVLIICRFLIHGEGYSISFKCKFSNRPIIPPEPAAPEDFFYNKINLLRNRGIINLLCGRLQPNIYYMTYIEDVYKMQFVDRIDLNIILRCCMYVPCTKYIYYEIIHANICNI